MAAGCLMGSRLYLFGGLQQEGSQMLVYNDLWEFDLATRRWSVSRQLLSMNDDVMHDIYLYYSVLTTGGCSQCPLSSLTLSFLDSTLHGVS